MKRRQFIYGLPIFSIAKAHASVVEPIQSLLVTEMKNHHILSALNADLLIYPASITKLMTLEITFFCLKKGILNLNDMLYMTDYSSRKAPTKLGLKIGEAISVRNAIEAVCVHSCNDIASLLAEKIGGSEGAFVTMMNHRAIAMGMQSTVYHNATGLPNISNNISTARDITLIANHIWDNYPEYTGFLGLTSFVWNNKVYHNSNKLMGVVPGMDFCKTGYIHASGFNIVASFIRRETRYLCVITGCQTQDARDRSLLNIVTRLS